MTNVPEPVAKRADQLVVGDRILEKHLPYRFHKGPADVVLVRGEDEDTSEPHTWIAYQYSNGRHESHAVLSESELEVIPADTGLGYSRADDGETTQPIAGRVPPHYGVVEVAGGLVEVDTAGAPNPAECKDPWHFVENDARSCPTCGWEV